NKKRISTLLDFWKTEQSKARVRAAFPEDMQKALPYDGLEEANAAFPLYRMAGWVLDYSKLMKLGIPGLLAEIGQCQKEHPQEILYQAMAGALELVVCCGKHYIREIDEELQKRENLSDQRKKQLMCIRESLAAICVHAPKTMHEAMQLAWLYSLLCVTMDYGRMDDYIGEFYIRDLESGRLTQTEAQEYVNSFWTMIADTDESVHGRVMIGGRGRKHEASADAFALLAMEASRQVVRHIPQLSLRLYQGCNPALLEKALDVLGHKSFGSPNGIINLLRVVELALFDETKTYSDFEELYQVFLTYCDYYFTYLARQEELEYRIAGEEAPYLLQSML
ncbi:MAG: pyruvate formate lyase family protein, partial [Lachnospiraceae bacterium]|nr:pyruvate formate lyase family protein [Lachnospiraceae bacterium]